ncbi:MAG TPA: pseudouridine-5'-phosphate glycosidase [Flavobacteriales bacterium]|nr:pseudouridine-5'-phosphate glycosidase [Flavobacteriales bacterium]HHZ95697.1 pseudouridine-5'-phosphate glycosidase [Flavobacteriales bacterium]HIB76489.1 pseudouridine-5'-phosphate glycosidase [Flavobacteriales bacterium]
MTDQLVYSDEVRDAIRGGVPVVALESTIIAHGMPYPENVQTANRLCEIIREGGCVPAIVAVADGKLHVGIDDGLLERLGTEEGVLKVSRRDMPVALAMGSLGATTVSGTLIAAHLAGIKVFVTGGIGGVHRGAEETMDVSADLKELEISDVAVVSAGVKAILDLPKTLEVLETKGVPVIGYQVDELPAFYTRSSGLKLVAKADNATEVAMIMQSKWGLGLNGAILVANPIPEKFEADSEVIERAINEALGLALEKGIKGKAVTPFMLAHVAEVTGGGSLEANVALVENNARVGAEIAVAFAKLV